MSLLTENHCVRYKGWTVVIAPIAPRAPNNDPRDGFLRAPGAAAAALAEQEALGEINALWAAMDALLLSKPKFDIGGRVN